MGSDSPILADAGPPKTSARRLVKALVALAILLWGISFFFYIPPQRAVSSGQFGPVSTTSGKSVTIAAPDGLGTSRLRSINLRFQFRVNKFVTYENLFQTGPQNLGIRAELSKSVQGHRSVALISQLADGTDFIPPLVDNIIIGKTYSVRINIYRGSRITAWVDGQMQFSYSFPTPIIEPSLGDVAVGTGYSQTRPFDGVINGFRLSFREFVSPTPSATPSALRILAALVLALALVIFLLRFSADELATRLLRQSEKRDSTRRLTQLLEGRFILVGLLLVVAGTTILEVVTPPENVVLQRSGEQIFRSAGVSPGKMTSYDLAGAPQLFSSADSLDVYISFDMKLDVTPPSHGHFSPVVVSTMSGDQGITFYLLPGGGLAATWGQAYISGPTGALLSKRLPRGQWVSVQAIMKRNRSSQFLIDGQQVSAFMWALPNLNAVPSQILVGGDTSQRVLAFMWASPNFNVVPPPIMIGGRSGTFGGSIANLKMKVVLYREPSSRVNYLLVRSSQLLAMLAIAFGVILLARRFLSRLIPVAAGVNRSLVLMIFGTTGAGILVNLLVDQLHVQQSPIPYFERNTWLATQVPQFSDFTQVLEIFRSLNPYGVQAGSYPPIGYWLVAPFSWMSQYASLFVFFAICGGFMFWWFKRSFTSGLSRIEQVLVVVTIFLSLPVSFTFDRANIDLLVFILVIIGTAAFEEKRSGLAALWLGVATAAKLFPGLYLLLFLRRRRPYFLLAVAVVICTTVIAMLGFDGSLRQNLVGFSSSLLSSNPGGKFGSTYTNTSLVGAAQGIGLAISGPQGMAMAWRAIHPFMILLELTGLTFLTWYLWRKEQSLWRATTLATVAFLLLPEVSYYYELIFLLIPVALFVREGSINPRTLRIACLFGLVLAPKAYWYVANSQVDVSVLFSAPLLVALAIAVIHDGVSDRRNNDDVRGVNHAVLYEESLSVKAAGNSES